MHIFETNGAPYKRLWPAKYSPEMTQLCLAITTQACV